MDLCLGFHQLLDKGSKILDIFDQHDRINIFVILSVIEQWPCANVLKLEVAADLSVVCAIRMNFKNNHTIL